MQHNCSCTHNFCYTGFFLEPVETDASLRALGIGAGISHATSCSCLNKNVRTLEYSKVLTTTPTSGKDTTPFNVRSLTDTKIPPAHWGVALSLQPPSHFVETLWTSTYHLAEGDWYWYAVSQHWERVSLETYRQHSKTLLWGMSLIHWRRKK